MSAEIVRRIRIACDATTRIGQCPANREWAAGGIDDARVLAARSGWSHAEGRDHCPVHADRNRPQGTP